MLFMLDLICLIRSQSNTFNKKKTTLNCLEKNICLIVMEKLTHFRLLYYFCLFYFKNTILFTVILSAAELWRTAVGGTIT